MTTLVRWKPNRHMHKMHTDMDRLIESFFETPQLRHTASRNIALDVVETESGYTISAAVPGIKSDEIDIVVEDGILTISGEMKNSFEQASEETDAENGPAPKFHLRERFYGSFSRKLRLPKDVDIDAISAAQEDGILTVQLAKSAAAQPKKISVA